MPTLNWIGKEAVINHHNDVPFKTLDLQYTTDASNVSENKIIHGDNLEALKALLPEYESRIKCIYIDPPYNTGNENWVYNDNVNSPRIRKWLGQVVGKEAEDLTRHDKWLCMMYPRLKLLQKLLSDDGAIFISIDDNEQANLKLICDEIFGSGNFVEIFSWRKTYTPSNLSHKTKKCVEYIYCYSKNINSLGRFKGLSKVNDADNPLLKSNNNVKTLVFPKDKIECTLKDDAYFKAGVYGTKVNQVILQKDVEYKNGKFLQDVELEAKFIWTQEMLDSEVDKSTRIIFKGQSFAPRYDRTEYNPEVPRNLIDNEDNVSTTEEGGKILQAIFQSKVFDYPKPPTLIQYLINFLCDKTSIILDSFAGSGTTAHAVLNLNKQDGGNRKFILVEMEDYAESITAERVRRVINGYGEGKNAVAGTGGSFSYYELGEPIMNDGYLNENQPIEKIRAYIWYTETHTVLRQTQGVAVSETFPEPVEGANMPAKCKYYLGKHNNAGYYFYYEKTANTSLDKAFLNTITEAADQYIIYADNCLLSDEFMRLNHIIFKKIPRDIRKF